MPIQRLSCLTRPCGWRASHWMDALTIGSVGAEIAKRLSNLFSSDDLRARRSGCSETSSNDELSVLLQRSGNATDWLSRSAAGIPSVAGARPGCQRAPTILVPAGNRTTKGLTHGPTTMGASSLMKIMSMQPSGSTRCAYSLWQPVIDCVQRHKKWSANDRGGAYS